MITNTIINDNNATSKDILKLINIIKKNVLETSNIILDLELNIL